jgi:DNA polymerase-3 subunit epsilon
VGNASNRTNFYRFSPPPNPLNFMANVIHTIDFEGNRKIGIVEFGVVSIRDFEITAARGELCNEDFYSQLEYFLGLRSCGLFAAHSAQIEDGLLRHYWASPGLVPTFQGDAAAPRWGPWIDSKLLHRRLFPGLQSYELGQLIETFSLCEQLSELSKIHCQNSTAKFHCALFDALAAALLLINLSKQLPHSTAESLARICEN